MESGYSARESLAIQVKGLTKSFGRTGVLRGLDLEVRWGEVVTVLGPNGSGKTTLVKILATLSRPDAGTVRVAGGELSRSGRAIRALIGVVTHDTLLYDDLSAYENLKFHARMFGLDRIDERIERVAGAMGVSESLRRRVGTLSHGIRKRIGIARALLHEPRILLMDEPESGLDQGALAMLEQVVSDRTVPHRTVLITTHNLERGLALGDRVVILARGKIAYESSLGSMGVDALKEAYLQHAGAIQ